MNATQIQDAAISRLLCTPSMMLKWTDADERNLQEKVSKIAAEAGRNTSSFRDKMFRKNLRRKMFHSAKLIASV